MYNLYRLYGGKNSKDDIQVIYTKQKDSKRYSVMKRNTDNGMKSPEYDFIRRYCYDCCLLPVYDPCKRTAGSLAQAKQYRIDNIRILKDERIDELKKEIESLEDDSSDLQLNRENQDEEVNNINAKIIEVNSKQISIIDEKIRLLKE